MPIKKVIADQRVSVKIWTDDVDERSKEQLTNIASLPFIHHHVAAMPDVHLGIGATIGSVIAIHKAIIPAAVGVDIGCGMVAARLSLTANDIDEKALQKIFDQISRDVPVGRGQHADDRVLVDAAKPFESGLKSLTDRHPELLKAFGKFSKWTNQMGTLGGGNHFIEVCLDESDQIWVMLHSGSRAIGNAIADYFIKLAWKDMERWMIQLPDRDLAYFPEGSKHFADYVEAVQWAQQYAMQNRTSMLELGEDVDRIVGLEVGADDYLGKPFAFSRICPLRATLRCRRIDMPATLDWSSEKARVYRCTVPWFRKTYEQPLFFSDKDYHATQKTLAIRCSAHPGSGCRRRVGYTRAGC